MFKNHRVHAVVVAGGMGKRFGGSIPKQFCMLKGSPVVVHSVSKFFRNKFVDYIYVSVASEYKQMCSELLNPISEDIKLVDGGKERQDSVFNAFSAINKFDNSDIVLIHDAARPFVTDDIISRLLKKVLEANAAVPMLKLTDTICRVQDGYVLSYEDRDAVHSLQTPQVFQFGVLDKSFRDTAEMNVKFTDESSMAVTAGFKVAVVEGFAENIKITDRQDLFTAELILERRCTG